MTITTPKHQLPPKLKSNDLKSVRIMSWPIMAVHAELGFLLHIILHLFESRSKVSAAVGTNLFPKLSKFNVIMRDPSYTILDFTDCTSQNIRMSTIAWPETGIAYLDKHSLTLALRMFCWYYLSKRTFFWFIYLLLTELETPPKPWSFH